MNKGFDKITYNNSFNSMKYDRINLMVKKGVKDKIKEYAEAHGESVNAYINRLIENDMSKEMPRV